MTKRAGQWGSIAAVVVAVLLLLLWPLLVVRRLAAQGPSGTFNGVQFGTVLPPSCNPASSVPFNPFFYLTTSSGANYPGFYPCNASGVYGPAGSSFGAQYVFVAADFTTANNTNLQAITGLTWTMPANAAINVPFTCHLAYSQATAAVSDAFGIQDVTVAPTNIFATGAMNTNVTATTQANLPTLTTTTATAIVTATPSAITTIWNADLNGLIQQPSNASSSAINILVSTATGADAVTVKQGSFCWHP